MNLIYLCGGVGKRAKLGYPKQFVFIAGKPIFLHGLEKFCKIDKIDKIIIPTSDIVKTCEYMNYFGKFSEINNDGYSSIKFNDKEILLIENGISRQDSVKKSLEYVTSEFVLIGEGVRPFITIELIEHVINTHSNFVTPVIHPKSTPLSKADGCCMDRTLICEVQLPQKFNFSLLKKAYTGCEKLTDHNYNNYTDDCHLVNNILGASISCIPGIEENIKITTPLDIEISQTIYKYSNGGTNE